MWNKALFLNGLIVMCKASTVNILSKLQITGEVPVQQDTRSVGNYMTSDDETLHRLVNHLMQDYNKKERPLVMNATVGNEITEVTMRIALLGLLDVDVHTLQIKTSIQLIMKWLDPLLSWNASEFNGVTYINIPSTLVWTPDIILYNLASPDFMNSVIKTNVIINSEGVVRMVTYGVFGSTCHLDLQWYPFDQQICHLEFASASYDTTKINIILAQSTLVQYRSNNDFFMEDFSVRLQDKYFPCCPFRMSTAKFTIQFQRRQKYLVFFITIAGVLINVAGAIAYLITNDEKSRIEVAVKSLFSMAVFLEASTRSFPPIEKIPLAGLYFGVCISMILVNIILSGVMINICFNPSKSPPDWIRTPITFLSWCVFLKLQHIPKRNNSISNSDSPDLKLEDVSDENQDNIDSNILFEKIFLKSVEKLAVHYESIEKLYENKVEQKNIKREWQEIGWVIGRCSFIIGMAFISLLSSVILSSSPYSLEFIYVKEKVYEKNQDWLGQINETEILQ